MLKKTILFAVVAGLVLALAPTSVMAAWVPPGPPPRGTGETKPDGTANTVPRAPVPPPGGYPDAYRLMYVTSGGYDADQTDINWYNNEVNTVANSAPSTVIGLTTWKMYGATAAVNARQNLGMLRSDEVGYDAATDVPIFNFAGSMLALNNDEFWTMDFTIDTDDGIYDQLSYEDGTEETDHDVEGVNSNVYSAWWSGMYNSGDADPLYPLGAEFVARGLGYKTVAEPANRWNNWGEALKSTIAPNPPGRVGVNGHTEWINSYPRLRGVSDVIPEPVTMALLAFGGLGILIRRRRRS